MVNVLMNAAGTTSETFRIGKGGPTILKGTVLPPNSLGQNGDLYIRHGGDQGGLFYKANHSWKASSEFVETSGSEVIPSGSVRTIANDTSLVLVERETTYDDTTVTWDATSVGFGDTILTLPVGREGCNITVKDSGGAQSVPIHIIPQSPSKIDGQEEYMISTNLSAVSLVFAGGHWRIIGAI